MRPGQPDSFFSEMTPQDNYPLVLEALYKRLGAFHRQGATAYKPGLDKARAMARTLGDPHRKYRTIHIAGTNGKGSVSHSLASVLQSMGLKTGLYTSPHLVDFAERIRIDGVKIPHRQVTKFVEQNQGLIDIFDPSFFELATMMAFDWFARQDVDIAVIETGLGGLLDTTNIVSPEVSAITNVSLDHTNLLGKTPAQIAAQKAGIIKPETPVVVGRTDPETLPVFQKVSSENEAPLYLTSPLEFTASPDALIYHNTPWGEIRADLNGECQPENMAVILKVLEILGIKDAAAVRNGLAHVVTNTGLMGRWTRLGTDPAVYIDTAHNPDGIAHLAKELRHHDNLHIVTGFSADKDIAQALEMLPQDATYYYVAAPGERAADVHMLSAVGDRAKRNGKPYPTVTDGYRAAIDAAGRHGTVVICGSNYIIGDLLEHIDL